MVAASIASMTPGAGSARLGAGVFDLGDLVSMAALDEVLLKREPRTFDGSDARADRVVRGGKNRRIDAEPGPDRCGGAGECSSGREPLRSEQTHR